MSVWFNKTISISDFEQWDEDTLSSHLGIRFLEIGTNYLKASMPVDNKTRQPYGLLHGGASLVLAETVGSIGSALIIDRKNFQCVGLEINANHIRSVRSGFVIATGTVLHVGKTTHVWDIKIHDESSQLICVSRFTVAILSKI